MAHVIAVQQVGVLALLGERHFQGVGQGGFAGAGQAGEPDALRHLVLLLGAVVLGDVGLVPDDFGLGLVFALLVGA